MPTISTDAFALKNSGLDAFLHAGVGIESNGSMLTILSMVARLGADPWAQAARWAALPRAGVIDSLAQSIAQMPLVPSALADSRATAARLVQLLPTTAHKLPPSDPASSERSATSYTLPILLIYCVVAFGMALNAFLAQRQQPAVPTPLAQSAAAAQANDTAAQPHLHDGLTTGPVAAAIGQ